jgi:F-type H+-transporting ATPase subunit c
VFAALILALSSAPELETFLFKFALLGFALSEAVGLLALMMAFLILYA